MEPAKIDRQTTTPFLLKLFYKTSSHHSVNDFHPTGPQPTHVQIYTWPSATLTELSQLIANNLPQLLPSPNVGTRMSFELVYPDMQAPVGRDGEGKYRMKPLGSVVLGATPKGSNGTTNGDKEDDSGLGDDAITGDELKTLADAKFVIGDYVDCAILPPLPNGDIAPVPRSTIVAPVGGRAGPSGRGENGFDGRLNGGGGYGGRRGRGNFGDAGRLGGFGGDSRGGGGVPSGEWRRGDVPPAGFDRGGGGSGRGRGRGRGW